MQRDGLIASTSIQATREAIADYLRAMMDALHSPDHEPLLREAAARVDKPGSRSVVHWWSSRLANLRTDDHGEWAYVLAMGLRFLPESDLERLRQMSPWRNRALLFVHYGIGFVEQPMLITRDAPINNDSYDRASALITAAGYRVNDADSYLVVFDAGPSVYWLDCGRCGVEAPRST